MATFNLSFFSPPGAPIPVAILPSARDFQIPAGHKLKNRAEKSSATDYLTDVTDVRQVRLLGPMYRM
ncbi:hypothetical protein QUB63_30835 [Microcoleus sp. ARI1-B5]|uniref:hypothetical protein n=1 Tax=unclassified Microcoleus TaxID=2642155 RepID=UPI002FD3E65F